MILCSKHLNDFTYLNNLIVILYLGCPDVKEKEVRTIQQMKTMRKNQNSTSSQNYQPSHLDHLSIDKIVNFINHVMCMYI